MIISHVKIIAFQTIIIHCLWYFILLEKTVVYIINRIIHVCLEIPDLFVVLNMISRSTLEINWVFPPTHMYYPLYNISTIAHCNILATKQK